MVIENKLQKTTASQRRHFGRRTDYKRPQPRRGGIMVEEQITKGPQPRRGGIMVEEQITKDHSLAEAALW